MSKIIKILYFIDVVLDLLFFRDNFGKFTNKVFFFINYEILRMKCLCHL